MLALRQSLLVTETSSIFISKLSMYTISSLACTRLQFLNLQDCTALTDESILQLGRYCRRLQLLNLSGCQLLTDKAVSSVGSGCGRLVSLNISRCVKISDKGVRSIATGYVRTKKSIILLIISLNAMCYVNKLREFASSQFSRIDSNHRRSSIVSRFPMPGTAYVELDRL